MESSIWRDLISTGWTPPPALWLDREPNTGEMALVWIVEGDEPFKHGISEIAYWDGKIWVDIQENPVAVGLDRVVCWAPAPSIETMHGYRKQLLKLDGSVRSKTGECRWNQRPGSTDADEPYDENGRPV